MSKFTLSAVSLLALLATPALADTVAGTWKMSVGKGEATCDLTLAAGERDNAGTASGAGDCPGGLYEVGRWRAVGASLDLLSPNGQLVAKLRAGEDGYTGKRVGDSRTVALSR